MCFAGRTFLVFPVRLRLLTALYDALTERVFAFTDDLAQVAPLSSSFKYAIICHILTVLHLLNGLVAFLTNNSVKAVQNYRLGKLNCYVWCYFFKLSQLNLNAATECLLSTSGGDHRMIIGLLFSGWLFKFWRNNKIWVVMSPRTIAGRGRCDS